MRFDPVSILSMAIALLLGLTIHEFAHAWAANRLGDPTPRWAGRVTLNPLAHLDPIGGVMFVLMILGFAPIAWGKPVPINPAYMRGGRRGAALATAAGPASNLVLALGVALLWRLIHEFTGAYLPYGAGARTLLLALMGVNVALAAFNLIPLPPLDGFGILEGVAPYSWLRVLEPLRRYGMWILLLVVLGGGALWSPLFQGLYRLVALVAGL